MEKYITVFEHQTIKLNQEFNGVKFDESKLKALQAYYGEKGCPYFSLIHNGIKFNEYVGVIQVGDITIEVLPKADKTNEHEGWRNVLIGMLIAVGYFDTHAPTSSSLKLKPNAILNLYFGLFIKEVEYLLHTGLVKQYRKKEGNLTALKGSLQFGKHIQQNLTHQERFYVCHTTYDVEHKIHFILYKTIRLLKQIDIDADLHSRVGALLLYFPEMPNLNVSEQTFDKLSLNRKTQCYKKALDIAKLILLQYHPDVTRGKNNILALMFDMNTLWERFVYISLSKHKNRDTTITAQTSKYFWQPKNGYRSKIRPDIVIKNKDKDFCIVLDTKWKNINDYNPSPDDLRQMYVYHEYYNAERVALIYPGKESFNKSGFYLDSITGMTTQKECSVIVLSVDTNVKKWQENIHSHFEEWIKH